MEAVSSKALLVGALVFLVGIIAVVAWAVTLPATVSATRTAILPAAPERVFDLVVSVADQPAWRRGLASVEVRDGGASWTEVTGNGIRIDFERVESRPPAVFEIRFSSPSGFRGEWRGEFATEQGGTRVTFTERVTTSSVVGRVMGRLFAPPGSQIEEYISDLRRALGPVGKDRS